MPLRASLASALASHLVAASLTLAALGCGGGTSTTSGAGGAGGVGGGGGGAGGDAGGGAGPSCPAQAPAEGEPCDVALEGDCAVPFDGEACPGVATCVARLDGDVWEHGPPTAGDPCGLKAVACGYVQYLENDADLTTLAICTELGWELFAGVCTSDAPCATCPDTLPADGEPCEGTYAHCGYAAEAVCGIIALGLSCVDGALEVEDAVCS